MDKSTASPVPSSTQSPKAALLGNWTTDAPSWTPSKATALLPISLPVAKPQRGWDRVPKPPVAQHSRVKQVWRRQYGLRSQPDSEEKEWQQVEEAHSNARQRSPAHIVKKKRIRSPSKKAVEMQDEEESEQNHAPTRWEKRRSGVKRKIPGKQADMPGFKLQEHILTAPSSFANALVEDSNGLKGLDQVSSVEEDKIEISYETVSKEDKQSQRSEGHTFEIVLPIFPSANLDPGAYAIPPESAEIALDVVSANETTTSLEHTSSPLPTVEAAPPDFPSPEDYYRQETTLDASEELNDAYVVRKNDGDTTSSTVALDEASQVAVDVQTPITSAYDEVVYPSLSVNDSEGSPVKQYYLPTSGSELILDLEAVTKSFDTFKCDQTPTDEESLKTGNSSSKVTTPKKEMMATKTVDDFDITDGLQLDIIGPTDTESTHGQTQISKGISTSNTVTAASDTLVEGEESLCSSLDEATVDFDATETLTMMHLEDDKARLRSFLNRAAANKASKVAITHRRESVQNRRDSDVIRKALASPRQILEEKDANLSPTKNLGLSEPTLTIDQLVVSPLPTIKRTSNDAGLDVSVDMPTFDTKNDDTMTIELDMLTGSPRRRSQRTKSRIPQIPSAAVVNMPNKIPVRTDGGERVILNRTEAQELANLMRKNTRKNKGGAIPPTERLAKLKAEAASAAITDGASSQDITLELNHRAKGVRWKEELVEFSDSIPTAELENSVDEIVTTAPMEGDASAAKEKRPTTSRLRRIKGLGGANGTPAKKLLSSTLLPEEVEEEAAEAAARAKEAAIPAPTEEVKKERKSRLQPPKKLMLNPSVMSLSGLPVLAGKENALQLLSPAKKLVGAGGKGKIPVPSSSGLGDGGRPVKRPRAPRKL